MRGMQSQTLDVPSREAFKLQSLELEYWRARAAQRGGGDAAAASRAAAAPELDKLLKTARSHGKWPRKSDVAALGAKAEAAQLAAERARAQAGSLEETATLTHQGGKAMHDLTPMSLGTNTTATVSSGASPRPAAGGASPPKAACALPNDAQAAVAQGAAAVLVTHQAMDASCVKQGPSGAERVDVHVAATHVEIHAQGVAAATQLEPEAPAEVQRTSKRTREVADDADADQPAASACKQSVAAEPCAPAADGAPAEAAGPCDRQELTLAQGSSPETTVPPQQAPPPSAAPGDSSKARGESSCAEAEQQQQQQQHAVLPPVAPKVVKDARPPRKVLQKLPVARIDENVPQVANALDSAKPGAGLPPRKSVNSRMRDRLGAIRADAAAAEEDTQFMDESD